MYLNIRYLPVYSFHFNQWFVYDEVDDIYIKPPKNVIELLSKFPVRQEQEDCLRDILEEPHDWLSDIVLREIKLVI